MGTATGLRRQEAARTTPMQPLSAPASVSVRGLQVIRGGATILRDVHLEVPAGTVYGLVGPSGSGKTTLLRAIIGR